MSQVLAEPQVSQTYITLRLSPAIEMTDDEFFALCQLNRDLRFERTAEGDIIVMAPTGGETGNRNADITAQLVTWTKRDSTGAAFDSSTGFKLPNGADRSPDGSWVRKSRLAALTHEQKLKFLPLCPDFVIELLSPTDTLAADAGKDDRVHRERRTVRMADRSRTATDSRVSPAPSRCRSWKTSRRSPPIRNSRALSSTCARFGNPTFSI